MDRGPIMSEEERKEILEWVYLNKNTFAPINNKRLHRLILKHPSDQVTNKVAVLKNPDIITSYDPTLHPYDATLPECVWKIKQRIIEKEHLEEYSQEPMLQDYIAVIHPSGSILKHTDPNKGNLIHCRFNVFLELPVEGGATYYDDRQVDTKEGSYVLSKSGLEEHHMYPIEKGNRIALSFGFLIPREKVDMMISVDFTIVPEPLDWDRFMTAMKLFSKPQGS
jgi:hypothetical protein